MSPRKDEMALDDVHVVEARKWDRMAERGHSDAQLRLEDADFGAHARRIATMTGIGEFLGDLRGKQVLELGCGLGTLSTLLARSGAKVTALDISPQSIDVARRRAALHGVADAIEFVVGPGEELPLNSARFDAATGKAVLHHLDASRAAPELARVLRPGARAAFAEPLGTNPLLTFARDHVPYPHKNPRGADIPLSYADIRNWEAPFSTAEHREVQLLAMLERAVGSKPMPRLRRVDGWLLKRAPALRPLCRYVVLTMSR